VIGERVRLAREASRLTQQELADTAGVAQGTLSEIESGRVIEPAPNLLKDIARATGFPESFFMGGPLPDLPEGRYRRLKMGASIKVDKQVRAQVRQVLEVIQRSESVLRLPPVAIEARRDRGLIGDIESIAGLVRQSLGVGPRDPIPNMTRAAERAGVVVVRLPSELPFHDGFSAWPDYGLDGRPVIALTGHRSPDRERFTIAHELGHLVLHTLRGDELSPKQAEDEANRFGGAILIPLPAAREAMRPPVTLRILMSVKAHYGVSIAACAQRALDVGLISREHFVSLRKQLSARQWTRQEPVDVTPEQPLLIRKIVDGLAGAGSPLERARRVSMPTFTLQAIAPVNPRVRRIGSAPA
jgi:Zn-dependent peptidase ImmA (M78 family)/transcriptional regulator with XRE-family HTH domain